MDQNRREFLGAGFGVSAQLAVSAEPGAELTNLSLWGSLRKGA